MKREGGLLKALDALNVGEFPDARDVTHLFRRTQKGRLAPYAVDEKSVVAMAKKLLEAVEALEAALTSQRRTSSTAEDTSTCGEGPSP